MATQFDLSKFSEKSTCPTHGEVVYLPTAQPQPVEAYEERYRAFEDSLASPDDILAVIDEMVDNPVFQFVLDFKMRMGVFSGMTFEARAKEEVKMAATLFTALESRRRYVPPEGTEKFFNPTGVSK